MLINAIKFIVFAQSYIGAFFVLLWWHNDLQFAPWWLNTSVFIVACAFLVAPLIWMYFDNEEYKENNRRLERLRYLEKKHYFAD